MTAAGVSGVGVGRVEVAATFAAAMPVALGDAVAIGVAVVSVGTVGNTSLDAATGVAITIVGGVGGGDGGVVSMVPRYHLPSGASNRAVPLGWLKSLISSAVDEVDVVMSPLGTVPHALTVQINSKKIFFTDC